jgi:aminopeptidase N
MEATTGRDLGPFFEAWIHGSTVPRVAFTYRSTDPGSIIVKFEQRGEIAPVPITVTVTYTNGETESIVVPVTERVVERTIKVKGALRRVDANEDNAALVEIEKLGS